MTARNWGLSGWLTFVAGGFVLAGAAFGLLAYDRRLFLLACGIGTFGYCCYRIPNRNLLAELEAARDRLSAYNASDSRADLAEAPLTPPGGTELYDQDAEPAQLDPIYPRLCTYCGQPQHYGSCPPDALAARAAEAKAAIVPPGHLGQACGWWDGTTDCGDPAEGWTRWPDGEPVWLCGVHLAWGREQADDDASDGPRSVPGRGQ